jgi:mycothione reductase
MNRTGSTSFRKRRSAMKEYDYITIGTGSGLALVDAILHENEDVKIAVIDKDEPGGICLTRACIPSKILLYSAELVRLFEKSSEFGIDVENVTSDFSRVMQRMRDLIGEDMANIRKSLENSESIDYYHQAAEFTAPYTLRAGTETITAKTIFLCTGSKPSLPPIKGLDQVHFETTDTILALDTCPPRLAIVGGGYIAAEYGHFFSAMGSSVTVIGRNPRFLPEEEPEISTLATLELKKHMKILTNHEVRETRPGEGGTILLDAFDRTTQTNVSIETDMVLVATGRSSNTDILHPEKSGVKVDNAGWIVVDEYLQTTQPGIWALGDANGRYLFKNVANYEASVVYRNAMHGAGEKVDYTVVPSAVFTSPEIASAGLLEKDAISRYGRDNILIGVARYIDTAKGLAIGAEKEFAKIIVDSSLMAIIGAHVIGPHASILIQELVHSLARPSHTVFEVSSALHVHPSLSEVVQDACQNLMSIEQYHHIVKEHFGLPVPDWE